MKKKNSTDHNARAKPNSNYVACRNCALDDICRPIPLGAGKPFSYILDNMERRAPLVSGDSLYNEGDQLSSIYAVTSGCLKLTKLTSENKRQIVGFRFPGELLGDEALYQKEHINSAIAIEDTSVCKILITDIEGISKHVPSFQNAFFSLITKQCHLIHRQFSAYVARNSVEEKVAAFLVNLSERCGQTNNLCSKLHLSMSRSDIANFLGIRHETLSRTLSKLQSQDVIGIQGKLIYINDLDALKASSQY